MFRQLRVRGGKFKVNPASISPSHKLDKVLVKQIKIAARRKIHGFLDWFTKEYMYGNRGLGFSQLKRDMRSWYQRGRFTAPSNIATDPNRHAPPRVRSNKKGKSNKKKNVTPDLVVPVWKQQQAMLARPDSVPSASIETSPDFELFGGESLGNVHDDKHLAQWRRKTRLPVESKAFTPEPDDATLNRFVPGAPMKTKPIPDGLPDDMKARFWRWQTGAYSARTKYAGAPDSAQTIQDDTVPGTKPNSGRTDRKSVV